MCETQPEREDAACVSVCACVKSHSRCRSSCDAAVCATLDDFPLFFIICSALDLRTVVRVGFSVAADTCTYTHAHSHAHAHT
jgi:hypothetical protein